MKDLYDVPRGKPEWLGDNPAEAVYEFARKHPEFVLEKPAWRLNESELSEDATHRPGAWLLRKWLRVLSKIEHLSVVNLLRI